jgi:hypothetical protein
MSDKDIGGYTMRDKQVVQCDLQNNQGWLGDFDGPNLRQDDLWSNLIKETEVVDEGLTGDRVVNFVHTKNTVFKSFEMSKKLSTH